ncbi:MAG: hypothetical protein ACLFMS_02690 [Halorhodospira sp.]
MSDAGLTLLLLLFLAHLLAFAVVGLRRRAPYYGAVVVTFSLLSGSVAARLYVPEITLFNGYPLYEVLRVLAWPAAAVSLGWALLRLRARRAARVGEETRP